jgi:hypothetical protein
MKYISAILAALLVAGSLAVHSPYADEGHGDEYRVPSAVENATLILAEDGGGDHGRPSPEEARNVELERFSLACTAHIAGKWPPPRETAADPVHLIGNRYSVSRRPTFAP